jgi:molybdopterin-synthase adenylyltransferase
MKNPRFLRSPRSRMFKGLSISLPEMPSVTDRQEKIHGYDQKKLNEATILLIGAGGINGEISEGLVRKGTGKLVIYDYDEVEISNLNRQRFYKEDIGENKAIALCRNLKKESTCGSLLIAQPYAIEKHIEEGKVPDFDIAVVGVDHDKTRIDFSRYLLETNKPGIFLGISADTDRGYILIQEPARSCFACIFPPLETSGRMPCPNQPAVKDILKAIAGPALFAVDSLLMGLKRNWNYWIISLSGFVPDIKINHEKRDGCKLCGGR